MPSVTLPISGYADDHAYYQVSDSYPLSNTVGSTSSSGTKYSGVNLTRNANAVTYVYAKFDTSGIPQNATIKSVTGSMRLYGSTTSQSRTSTRQIQLYSGTTAKGSPTNFSMTGSATIFTIENSGSWTRSELDDIRIRVYAVRNTSYTTSNTYVYWLGGDVTIEYEEGGSSGGGSTPVDTTPATFEISENYGTYQGDVKYISDGSTSTGTWRANNSASAGRYVMWTYNKTVILESFSYSSSQSGEYVRSGSYLQISKDGNNWEDVGAFNGTSSQSFTNINKECQYVRIYAKSGSGYVAITEAMPVWREIAVASGTGLFLKIDGTVVEAKAIYRLVNGKLEAVDAKDLDQSVSYVRKYI